MVACGAPVPGGTLPHTVTFLTAKPSPLPSSDNVLTAIIAGTQKRRGEGAAPVTDSQHYRRTKGASRSSSPCEATGPPSRRAFSAGCFSCRTAPQPCQCSAAASLPTARCHVWRACRISPARLPSVLGGLPARGLLCRPLSGQVGRLPLQSGLPHYPCSRYQGTGSGWGSVSASLRHSAHPSPVPVRTIFLLVAHRQSGERWPC